VGAAGVRKWGAAFGRAGAILASYQARRAARTIERRWGIPAGELAVVTGGSIAHIYVGRRTRGSTLEEIQARFPDLLPLLERSPGIGLLTIRKSARGPLVSYGGR